MMKKRYLVKRYGLPAIVLLFLLIWLSQQNAADDNILYSRLVEQQSAVYERLGKDRQSLHQERNPSRFLDTEQQSSHRNTTSQILLDSDAKKEVRPQSRDLFGKNRSQYRFVQVESSRNYSMVALSEDTQRQPVIELNSQRMVELDTKRLSDKNASDIVKYGMRSPPAANSESDRVAATNFPVDTSAEYRRFRQLIFNSSTVTHRAGPQSVAGTTSNDQSLNFNLVFSTIKPSTARQVSSDDDADDSLILARQMALKNFVKTDEKNQPSRQSDDNKVRSGVSDTVSVKPVQRDQYKHLFENAVANSSVERGRKQEIDELEKFAEVPALPDYELPMLKEKTQDGRLVSTTSTLSTVRPDLLHHGGISPVSYLVTESKDSGQKLDVDDEVLADTDDVMSSAVVLGEVNPNRTYAVFSTTTENRDALNFVFLLPLTALAWKRIGFDSIVIIVGPVDVWNSDELFHFVLSAVRQLDAVVVFLEPRPEKSVMISQV